MKKSLSIIAFLITTISYAQSQGSISYIVNVDTAQHYLNVQMDYVKDTPSGTPLKLKLPVWAPGYYLIVDYPKNLTDFSASADKGEATWRKEGKNAWIISASDADTIRADYRIYCNAHSVAESRVQNDIAFIAPNGIFMHPDNTQVPVQVTFRLPSNWQHISTGLKLSDCSSSGDGKAYTYCADNFDILYDSPLLLGNHHVHHFTHEGHEYEVALETPDGYYESGIEDDWKKVISETTKLMGDVPYDNYCLIHLGAGGGGLEHSNSQACYSNGTWRFNDRAAYINYLGFITHEYFHLYNVKSIRPIELGPFDYDREVFTPLLWVSEGFTVYYETQLMLRAGIITPEELLDELSGYFKNIETHEGQKHMSLRQSSYDIWLNFFNDNANHQATTISYYIKGPVIGLLFDCFIRNNTKGERSLDDLMRLLYNRYFLDAKRGFTEEEFWSAADEIAGTSTALLRHYVDTTDTIDYDALLSPLGIQLDHNAWKLSMQEKPKKNVAKLRKQLLGK